MAFRVRSWLAAACLAALAVLIWHAAGLPGEFGREREAVRAYQQGLDLLATGQYAQAAAAFRDVVTLAPRSVDAYGALAEAEFRQRHYDDAVNAYRRWLAIYPYSYVGALYREVGMIELRADRAADARRDLAQATALDPSDWLAFHLLGHAHRKLGDGTAARAAWQQVVRLNPTFAPAHEQLRRLGK